MGVGRCAHNGRPALVACPDVASWGDPPCVSFGSWDISSKRQFVMSCPITKTGAQRHAAETLRGNNDNWRLCLGAAVRHTHNDMLPAMKDRIGLVSKINRDIEG